MSRRDHIAVDIVPSRLSIRANFILDILIHGVFAAISLVIVYRGYLFAVRMDRLSSVTMDVQMSWLYAAVPLGFCLIFIKSILNVVISLSKLVQTKKNRVTATSHLCE